MTVTVAQLIQSASTLSTEQQLALNKALVQLIRGNRKVQAATIGASFQIGDVVRFDAKTKGIKFLKIAKFNRAGTCVVGHECNRDGSPFNSNPIRWTVGNTLCTKVA